MEETELKSQESQEVTSGNKRDELGRFIVGSNGNPNGRPPDTEEKKILKKVIRELVAEYKQTLADALPQISPVLIDQATKGNIQAIKEINDRVMGKPEQQTDITSGGEPIQPVLVKFLDGNK